jgi:hypothetical protein
MTRAGIAAAAVVLAMAGWAGCGKSGGDKPGAAGSAAAGSAAAPGSAANTPTAVEPEPEAAPSAVPVPPPGSHAGTAVFALSGALTAKLEAPAQCVCSADTASFTVKGGTLAGQQMPVELRVLVATAEDWANPPVLLTVPEPARGTYARNTYQPRPTDKVNAAKDCSGVTLDVTLRGMAGTKGDVVVKGAITCTP